MSAARGCEVIEELNATTGLALSGTALLAAFAGWLRWFRPRYRKTKQDGVAIRDAILGRPPVLDTITKKEIAPALPGIGERMATVEEALITFAQNRHDLDGLIKTVGHHDERLKALEEASVERVVAKAESAAAWRAMEAAANSQPPLEAESDE